jgi:glycosyltransferase involved in cell wall biosynthesis
MGKLTITQVCPTFSPNIGGLETHVREISERLVERGFEVEVLTTDPSGNLPTKESINGVSVMRFRSWAPHGAYYFSADLKKFLASRSSAYDILHAHNYHALPALYATRAKSRGFVFTPHYHGGSYVFFRKLLHVPYRHIAKKIFEKADTIVCVSDSEKNLIMSRFNVREQKLTVIHNGVDRQEFTGIRKIRESSRKVILYAGRLEEYKGIDYVIKALPRLSENIHLEIVGDGPHKNVLRKLADKVRVTSRVTFNPSLPRPELIQKYAAASLFVLLSRYEAYGISVAEALAAGTPCIVADAAGLADWIDNENCYGVEYPVDMEKLVSMINIAINREITPLSLPTWDTAVDKLIKLYEDALTTKDT